MQFKKSNLTTLFSECNNVMRAQIKLRVLIADMGAGSKGCRYETPRIMLAWQLQSNL